MAASQDFVRGYWIVRGDWAPSLGVFARSGLLDRERVDAAGWGDIGTFVITASSGSSSSESWKSFSISLAVLRRRLDELLRACGRTGEVETRVIRGLEGDLGEGERFCGCRRIGEGTLPLGRGGMCSVGLGRGAFPCCGDLCSRTLRTWLLSVTEVLNSLLKSLRFVAD